MNPRKPSYYSTTRLSIALEERKENLSQSILPGFNNEC